MGGGIYTVQKPVLCRLVSGFDFPIWCFTLGGEREKRGLAYNREFEKSNMN